ncbi:MAG: hypothetical protein DRI44_05020 [Chlamydiae bacterium]|nr:MAG: hypothetical protein DRI44_05020 [Chlamydiota bacterium]
MKKNNFIFSIIFFCGLQSTIYADTFSNNWAMEIIKYEPGNNVFGAYTNANTALGPASRFTYADKEMTNAASVTIINPPWQSDQIVSIGIGGKLIVKMGTEVRNYNDPEHPYGVDLLIFGNTLFAYIDDEGLPQTNPWYATSEEPAEIWVSADLTNWFMATNCFADSLMPTQSVDLNGHTSNYLFPPNPALLTNDWTSLSGTWSYSNTVAAYEGSAGGAPVDLSQLKTSSGQSTNLSFINYVKIENPRTEDAAEIDAIASVPILPEPYYLLFIIKYLLFISRKSLIQYYPLRVEAGYTIIQQ